MSAAWACRCLVYILACESCEWCNSVSIGIIEKGKFIHLEVVSQSAHSLKMADAVWRAAAILRKQAGYEIIRNLLHGCGVHDHTLTEQWSRRFVRFFCLRKNAGNSVFLQANTFCFLSLTIYTGGPWSGMNTHVIHKSWKAQHEPPYEWLLSTLIRCALRYTTMIWYEDCLTIDRLSLIHKCISQSGLLIMWLYGMVIWRHQFEVMGRQACVRLAFCSCWQFYSILLLSLTLLDTVRLWNDII